MRICGTYSRQTSPNAPKTKLPLILDSIQVTLIHSMEKCVCYTVKEPFASNERAKELSHIIREETVKLKGTRDVESIITNLDIIPLKVSSLCDLKLIKVSIFESSKYLVFQHLYQMGYFITDGTKYSGDFLVYSEWPDNAHAIFIAVIIEDSCRMKDVVSLCRLANSVKKSVLACFINKSQIVTKVFDFLSQGL